MTMTKDPLAIEAAEALQTACRRVSGAAHYLLTDLSVGDGSARDVLQALYDEALAIRNLAEALAEMLAEGHGDSYDGP